MPPKKPSSTTPKKQAIQAMVSQKTPRRSVASSSSSSEDREAPKIETITPRRSTSSSSSNTVSSSKKEPTSLTKISKAEPSSSYKGTRIQKAGKKKAEASSSQKRRKTPEELQQIKPSSIKRCARMAGIMRLGRDHLAMAREIIDSDLAEVLNKAATLTLYKKRKTIQHVELAKVVESLWGIKLYPFADKNVDYASALDDNEDLDKDYTESDESDVTHESEEEEDN